MPCVGRREKTINIVPTLFYLFRNAWHHLAAVVVVKRCLAQMALSASSPPHRPDVLAVGEYLAVFVPGYHALVALVRAARHKTRTRQLGRSPRGRRSAVVIAHVRSLN